MSEILAQQVNIETAESAARGAFYEYEDKLRVAANMAALAIVETGGITEDRSAFLLAMHGIGPMERVYAGNGGMGEVLQKYDELEEKFGTFQSKQPVAVISKVVGAISETDVQIREMGFILKTEYDYKKRGEQSPLRYEIYEATDSHRDVRGRVLLPVTNILEFQYSDTQTTDRKDQANYCLMHLTRNSEASPITESVDITDYSDKFKVGWHNIYAARELGSKRNDEVEDSYFLDRISEAKKEYKELMRFRMV